MANNPLDINNITDILCVGATKLGVLSTLVMAEYWPNKRFVITDSQAAIHSWQDPNNLRVFEPGLPNLLVARTAPPPNAGNVTFQAMDIPTQVNNCQMVIVAPKVETKKRGIGANRKLNLASWDQALRQILTHSQHRSIIVMKCTLPHNVTSAIENIMRDVVVDNHDAPNHSIFWIPEFFSAGTALENIRHPSRIVISRCYGDMNMGTVANFYLQTQVLWVNNNNILLHGDHTTAAIGTMGSNVMLAFKATLMEITTRYCDRVTGANAAEARNIIRTDPRIGDQFLNITAGFGGGALLRDLLSFKHLAELNNDKLVSDLIDIVIKCNVKYKEDFVAQILDHLNALEQKVVIILGFSYKPDTESVDNSAAILICQKLCLEKARIRIYDPKAFAADIRACFSRVYTQGNNPRITVHQNMDNQLWQGANAICFLQNSEDYDQLNFGQIFQMIAQTTVYLFDTCGALQPHLQAIQQVNHEFQNPCYKLKIRGCHDLVVG